MEWVETTGKSVDEAKNKALDQLGVAEDDAEIVVLDEPRAGLFGRVRGEARVRARVRPTTPRPKVERRDRKKSAKGDKVDQNESADVADSTDAPAKPARARGDKPARVSASKVAAASDVAPAPKPRRGTARTAAGAGRESTVSGSDSGHDPFDVFEGESARSESARSDEARSDEARTSERGAERGGGGGSVRPSRSRKDGARAANAVSANNDQVEETTVDAAQVGEEARVFVQGVVDAFGLVGTAAVRREDDDLEVTVDGSDLGLLVGPRGATLQALQELTRVAAQRRLGDHDTRLRVDVGGYRERRKEALSRFAHQVAEQVVADGSPKRLEPMSSSDRKVIHDVLSDVEGVVTRSEGDDPRRCVVIAPAND